MLPRTEWTVADMAPGRAVRGSAAKWRRARTVPRPEFCIPTSMETVLRMMVGYPVSLAAR